MDLKSIMEISELRPLGVLDQRIGKLRENFRDTVSNGQMNALTKLLSETRAYAAQNLASPPYGQTFAAQMNVLAFDLRSAVADMPPVGAHTRSAIATNIDINNLRSSHLSVASSITRQMNALAHDPLSSVANTLSIGAHTRSALNQIANIKNVLNSHVSAANSMQKQLDAVVGLGSPNSLAMGCVKGSMDSFRLPDLSETSRLLRDVESSTMSQYGLTRSLMESFLAGLKNPWINIHDQLTSITAMAKLHGIGNLIATQPSFTLKAAATLRLDLGDWRDKITWSGNDATGTNTRADFYIERGFNPALTEFPNKTFEEGLKNSILQSNQPTLVKTYGDPVTGLGDDNEENFSRSDMIYGWFQRFETQIRHFIDRVMTTKFGVDWPRTKLPNGIYDQWVEKQRKDNSGHIWPLIYYADFTDYERIICKKDNWHSAFIQYLFRVESVRESFQRLHLPRIATMHARPLTLDDELFVFAEIRRFDSVFKT